MYWDIKIETIDRDSLENLQLKRLKKTLKTVYNNVPFYKEKFDSLL